MSKELEELKEWARRLAFPIYGAKVVEKIDSLLKSGEGTHHLWKTHRRNKQEHIYRCEYCEAKITRTPNDVAPDQGSHCPYWLEKDRHKSLRIIEESSKKFSLMEVSQDEAEAILKGAPSKFHAMERDGFTYRYTGNTLEYWSESSERWNVTIPKGDHLPRGKYIVTVVNDEEPVALSKEEKLAVSLPTRRETNIPDSIKKHCDYYNLELIVEALLPEIDRRIREGIKDTRIVYDHTWNDRYVKVEEDRGVDCEDIGLKLKLSIDE